MSDEPPSISKTVRIWFDYIGLGFVLTGIDQFTKPGRWIMGLCAVGIGGIFLFFGIMGPRLRGAFSKIPPTGLPSSSPAASSATSNPSTLKTNGLSPKQIAAEIDGARLLQKTEIREYYIGTPVDWLLKIDDIDEEISEKNLISFYDSDHLGPLVFLTVPRAGYEFLKLANKGDVFKVMGTIRVINPFNEMFLIHLENISLISPAANG